MNKKCTKCGKDGEREDFYKDKKTKDGLSYWCKVCSKEKQINYYKNNSGKVIDYQKEYSSKNRKKLSAYQKVYRENNYEKLQEYDKERTRKAKKRVMKEYGGECVCCGEKSIEFLTIDHIDGSGANHRREISGLLGKGFYLWLEKNNYPKDNFRILCMNCNFSVGHYGYCPHNNGIYNLSATVPGEKGWQWLPSKEK